MNSSSSSNHARGLSTMSGISFQSHDMSIVSPDNNNIEDQIRGTIQQFTTLFDSFVEEMKRKDEEVASNDESKELLVEKDKEISRLRTKFYLFE